MSRRSDGTFRCDRCGADVGNAGIQVALTITDLDPGTGTVVVYHFGREEGCAKKLLSARNLADYTEEHPA